MLTRRNDIRKYFLFIFLIFFSYFNECLNYSILKTFSLKIHDKSFGYISRYNERNTVILDATTKPNPTEYLPSSWRTFDGKDIFEGTLMIEFYSY